MAESTSLGAATQDRKARLAQLRSLKRKHPFPQGDEDGVEQTRESTKHLDLNDTDSRDPSITTTFLSGRNYDAETRGPKLGFEHAPTDGEQTLELQAQKLAEATKQRREEEEKANKPLDLFKLQPKRPNWDLKRDLDKKLQVLNVRTNNAIAKLVRERIQKAQQEASSKSSVPNGEDIAGLDGAAIVEALHAKEREGESPDLDMDED